MKLKICERNETDKIVASCSFVHLLVSTIYIAEGSQDGPLSSHHLLWMENHEDISAPGVPRSCLKRLPGEIPGHHHDHMLQPIYEKLVLFYWLDCRLGCCSALISGQPTAMTTTSQKPPWSVCQTPSLLAREQAPEKIEQSICFQPRTVTSHLDTLSEESQSEQPRRK